MDTNRYSRQIMLPEIGIDGQIKLQQAKVLLIGVGGLGSAILPYLVSAGIGEIGIIDNDTIELSNLPRQVIYKTAAVGKSKIQEAAAMALALNPTIKINAIDEKLNANNALSLFSQYDIMVDATDNLQTKYLINDACCATNKPFVYGSIYKFEGQVSVFNYKGGPSYRCLFPEGKNQSTNCNETGTLGVAVGIIGLFQANEVLKMIVETASILSGKLLVYNTLNNEQQKFEFKKRNTTKTDPLFFEHKYRTNSETEIEPSAVLEQINNPNVVFLDVRNQDEYPKIAFKNAVQIPLAVLENQLDQLDSNKEFFVFCQSGIRSKAAIAILQKHHFLKAKSILGGAKKLNRLQDNESISAI